ncbi:Helicase associated domain protein [Streptomyces sp. NPDC048290]|uniref:DEAD/DEAH box helicase n=1 Tax=Streptomyces sp. NPDC048290 TaxID=3155811 RepID=UPI0034374724
MSETPRAALWPHQQEAVEALTAAFATAERATAVLACGTGKTRIAAASVDALTGRSEAARVLVVVPFLELVTQTLREWCAVLGEPRLGRVVAVCSDKDVLREQPHPAGRRAAVTTGAEELARLTAGPGRVTVAVTYASLGCVAQAHAEHGLPMWDLIILDEAHRSAGSAGKASAIVHSNAFIPAALRQYMTATPRIVAGGGDSVSMDDPKVFGEVAYRLGFARATELGLLAGYRIIVPVVTDEEVRAAAEAADGFYQVGPSVVPPSVLATQIAVLRAARTYGLRRMITFHNRVSAARLFSGTLAHAAAHLPAGERPARLVVGHVHGSESLAHRKNTLSRLRAEDDSLVVISNARVLGEGIDVPAVDCVAFVDNRGSAIDCIQAVGRALRRGDRSKPKTASVIVPVLLKPGEDPEAALSTSRFAPVWQVVRALGAHDDGLAHRLSRMRQDLGARPAANNPDADSSDTLLTLPQWLEVTGIPVPPGFADAITVRTIRCATNTWDEFYGAALAFREEFGHTDIPSDWVTPTGLRLGSWWTKQRVAHNAGDLIQERAGRLVEAGMVWDQFGESWTTTCTEVKHRAAEQGHFVFDPDFTTSHGVIALNWCTAQRTLQRQGRLHPERRTLLDRIGFPWDARQDRWMRRFHQLKAVHDRRTSVLRLPGDMPEAVWLESQYVSHRNGRLDPWQLALMKTIGIDFTDRRRALWLSAYNMLKNFHTEHGHWNVPAGLRTPEDVDVRSWKATQRTSHKAGTLPAEFTDLLDKIGFPWDPARERWDARRTELARFYACHGHFSVPSGPLGNWYYQQCKKHREGKLSSGAENSLGAIHPLWHQRGRP